MRYIADLHLHSRYSRATSKTCTIPSLAAWAAVKGAHLLATGDFTHPQWMLHLKEFLTPAEPGFFKIRPDIQPHLSDPILQETSPESFDTRFVLSTEISSIYKYSGKVRKIHNLIYVPDLLSADLISARLATIGNIASDGRPILGLDSRDLLELVLELSPESFLVPAHIWTPWFSLFGVKSGFDSIEDCFRDLSSHIFCLETGLSSNPAMNRLISGLDRYTLMSNSDSHSPSRLCREANIFTTGFNFFSLREALRYPSDRQGRQRFESTIEFYPEEGKYHHDGHRKCNVCLEPGTRKDNNQPCPVCGKQLTTGVCSRILELADRSSPVYPACSPGVHSLIPLQEILAEITGVGPQSKTVTSLYIKLINIFGSELNILLHTPLADLRNKYSEVLAEAMKRVRKGIVRRTPGFDGCYGKIRVFSEKELR